MDHRQRSSTLAGICGSDCSSGGCVLPDRPLFRLPEAYWAPMSTLIVMQSTLSAALPISVQYVAGTAIGAAVGAVADVYFPTNVWAFGVAAFIIGLLCVVWRVERSAYRYASITLTIVMLVPRSKFSSGR